MQATAVILAAGLGTRMRSSIPKPLHKIAGRSMLRHLLTSCEQVFDRIVVVIGPNMEQVAREAAPHRTVVQHEQLGTAHAALAAQDMFGEGQITILYADNPLIRPQTFRALLERRAEGDVGLALLAFRPDDPARYGRVIVEEGFVSRIVEWADASEAIRQVGLCNAGVLCARAADMLRWLRAVRNDNAKKEYYLTDVVGVANQDRARVAAVEASAQEVMGVNSRVELSVAEAVAQRWLRTAAMESGVTMTDPDTVYLSADTELAPDVTIGPNVVLGPGVKVESGAEILPFCHITGCTIGAGSTVGPFTRIRPGTVLERDVHIGNFVELKASHLHDGVKAGHLTYLGDTTVGERTNVGAGTITCNYDGFAKHKTHIGARVFVGSDVALVAPVSVGDGAFLAAGSVITEDVSPDAMAIARGRQIEKPRRAAELRAAKKRKD